MKLGVITHTRCSESTYERTLVWLPDDMTEETFVAVVRAAQAEYLAFAQRFKNEPAPNDYRPHAPIPYQLYPHMTVADVGAEWVQKKIAWEKWEADRQQARKTFATYLDGRSGLKRFWDFEPPFTYDCDWGHQHGVTLDYDETQFD